MDAGGFRSKLGSDSQDSDDIMPPGTQRPLIKFTPNKGVEQAKKRLRAFSIQKKTSLSPVTIPKAVGTGTATVFIGKASAVKNVLKPVQEPSPDDAKKPPKPPKPGTVKPQESYICTQKKTLAEIEDMKRKMEMIELGIPLGLICPDPESKAMPTKAMPPIKTFLDRDKVDELIREAKKAKAEGKEFKFDYSKLLPDYANPFQRKKDLASESLSDTSKSHEHDRKSREKEKRRSDKYDSRRHSSYKSDEKYRHRDDKNRNRSKERRHSRETDRSKDRDRKDRDKNKEKDEKSSDRGSKYADKDSKSHELGESQDKNAQVQVNVTDKEAEVNLKDFVVCDSWSDNEEKSKDSTPKPEDIKVKSTHSVLVKNTTQDLIEILDKQDREIHTSPKPKLKRLNPVDSFKFEVVEADDGDDDFLDMFDENTSIEKFSKIKSKKDSEDPDMDQIFDYDNAKDEIFEGMADDTFLESVILEIKQEEMDDTSQDKGLVEYDESPSLDRAHNSVTPEIDEKTRRLHSSRSDYSDSYKSTESGYKSTESVKYSGYKSDNESEMVSVERKRHLDLAESTNVDKYTANSLDTWNFVLKICQPLLFRHDRNKCYKETRLSPKLWYTENPKVCNCVKDRSSVYEELDICKMELVDAIYGDREVAPLALEGCARSWYGRESQWPTSPVQPAADWEADDSQPEQGDHAQRYMEEWPDTVETKSATPRSSPLREATKKKAAEPLEGEKQKKRMKMTSEGWSQDSEVDEDVSKSYHALQDYLYEALHYNPKPETSSKKVKEKRKRKLSTSTSLTDSSESDVKRRKKMKKSKVNKQLKSKESKRRRSSKKHMKKLKEKQRKKKKGVKVSEDSDGEEYEKEKKKDKKHKKKKLQKQKKKVQKKKKSRAKSSSSSDSSSDSESEKEKLSRKKTKSDKKKKKKKGESEDLFDMNVLNNIKTERNSDDDMSKQMEFSPRRQKPREIINVKELQNDFVGIQIKQEVEENEKKLAEKRNVQIENEKSQESQTRIEVVKETPNQELKEQEDSESTLQPRPDDSNHSQCSSQESSCSVKEQALYEKDESHLRPSSQNSNYSFHDVMASKYSNNKQVEEVHPPEQDSRSQESHGRQSELDARLTLEREMQNFERSCERYSPCSLGYEPEMQSFNKELPRQDNDVSLQRESSTQDISRQEPERKVNERDPRLRGYQKPNIDADPGRDTQSYTQDLSQERALQSQSEQGIQNHDGITDQDYLQGNYEMYEQMAMAYQSDVANQLTSPPDGSRSRRIETVVRTRARGEIKCDWRAGDAHSAPATNRPSRWGLKPSDVNIVLTGGGEQYPAAEPVYKIQSIANRSDSSSISYDEAYMDTYGAADRLQYGDCFSGDAAATPRAAAPKTSSLDKRIDLVMRSTILGEVAKDLDESEDKECPDKGILVTKSLNTEGRCSKRVSFADGYKPGQDSDVEEPPVKKKKKPRRLGCAWPCPASHADHVPLWDALPPPPPPPGSPPPPAPPALPPLALLRQARPAPALLPAPHHDYKFDPNSMTAFMPPEPPPGLISFQNL